MFKLVHNPLDAKIGDIFFTSHIGLVDRLIRIFTTNPVSHVGIIVDIRKSSKPDGKGGMLHSVNWRTIEAFPPVVRFRDRHSDNDFFLNQKIQSKKHTIGIISIFRPEQTQPIYFAMKWLYETVGKWYDFLSVVRLGLIRLRRALPFIAVPLMKLFPWNNHPKWWMCAEKTIEYLAKLGYEDLPIGYGTAPGDLERYCINRLSGVV